MIYLAMQIVALGICWTPQVTATVVAQDSKPAEAVLQLATVSVRGHESGIRQIRPVDQQGYALLDDGALCSWKGDLLFLRHNETTAVRVLQLGARDQWGVAGSSNGNVVWRYRSNSQDMQLVELRAASDVRKLVSLQLGWKEAGYILGMALVDNRALIAALVAFDGEPIALVTCIDIQTGAIVWRQKLCSVNKQALDTALGSLRVPVRDHSSRNGQTTIAVSGERLYVAIPSLANCYALELDSGKIASQVEALWMYDLVYHGPSLSHYSVTKVEASMQEGQEPLGIRPLWACDSKAAGELAGGICVGREGEILAVVRRYALDKPLDAFVDEYCVLQLDPALHPQKISLLTARLLSQGIAGDEAKAAIALADGTIALYQYSDARVSAEFGPSSNRKGLTQTGWVGPILRPQHSEWLITGGGPLRPRLIDGRLIAPDSTGFVDRKRRSMSFDVRVVSTDTGMFDRITISVPFSGEIASPVTNYTTSDGTYHTLRHFGIELHDASFSNRVCCALFAGPDDSLQYVEFVPAEGM